MQTSTITINNTDTLRTLRIKNGLTQMEAANLIGVSEATLRSWEKDSAKIGYSFVRKIEAVYGASQEFIFFGSESTFSELIRNQALKGSDT